MAEIICKNLVFHFNKKHLEDPTIPMWTIKTGGRSFYVKHVSCTIPWSTKETPDNSSTKGSIKIHKALLKINDDQEAEILPLTPEDIDRIKMEKQHSRILIYSQHNEIRNFLRNNRIKHGPIKSFKGGCGEHYEVTDIEQLEDLVLLMFSFNGCYSRLKTNDYYDREYTKWISARLLK